MPNFPMISAEYIFTARDDEGNLILNTGGPRARLPTPWLGVSDSDGGLIDPLIRMPYVLPINDAGFAIFDVCSDLSQVDSITNAAFAMQTFSGRFQQIPFNFNPSKTKSSVSATITANNTVIIVSQELSDNWLSDEQTSEQLFCVASYNPETREPATCLERHSWPFSNLIARLADNKYYMFDHEINEIMQFERDPRSFEDRPQRADRFLTPSTMTYSAAVDITDTIWAAQTGKWYINQLPPIHWPNHGLLVNVVDPAFNSNSRIVWLKSDESDQLLPSLPVNNYGDVTYAFVGTTNGVVVIGQKPAADSDTSALAYSLEPGLWSSYWQPGSQWSSLSLVGPADYPGTLGSGRSRGSPIPFRPTCTFRADKKVSCIISDNAKISRIVLDERGQLLEPTHTLAPAIDYSDLDGTADASNPEAIGGYAYMKIEAIKGGEVIIYNVYAAKNTYDHVDSSIRVPPNWIGRIPLDLNQIPHNQFGDLNGFIIAHNQHWLDTHNGNPYVKLSDLPALLEAERQYPSDPALQTTTTPTTTTTTTTPPPPAQNYYSVMDDPLLNGTNAGMQLLSYGGNAFVSTEQGDFIELRGRNGHPRSGIRSVFRTRPHVVSALLPDHAKKPNHRLVVSDDGLGALALSRVNTAGELGTQTIQRFTPEKATYYLNPQIALSSAPSGKRAVQGVVAYMSDAPNTPIHPSPLAPTRFKINLQRIKETPSLLGDPRTVYGGNYDPSGYSIAARGDTGNGFLFGVITHPNDEGWTLLHTKQYDAQLNTEFTSEYYSTRFKVPVAGVPPTMAGLTTGKWVVGWLEGSPGSVEIKTMLMNAKGKALFDEPKVVHLAPGRYSELTCHATPDGGYEFGYQKQTISVSTNLQGGEPVSTSSFRNDWVVQTFNKRGISKQEPRVVLSFNSTEVTHIRSNVLANGDRILTCSTGSNAVLMQVFDSNWTPQPDNNKRELITEQSAIPYAAADTTAMVTTSAPVPTLLGDGADAAAGAEPTSIFTPGNVESAFNNASGTLMLAQWAIGMGSKMKSAWSSWWSGGPTADELAAELATVRAQIIQHQQTFNVHLSKQGLPKEVKHIYRALLDIKPAQLHVAKQLLNSVDRLQQQLQQPDADLTAIQQKLDLIKDNPEHDLDLDMLAHEASLFERDLAILKANTAQSAPPAAGIAATMHARTTQQTAGVLQHNASLPAPAARHRITAN